MAFGFIKKIGKGIKKVGKGAYKGVKKATSKHGVFGSRGFIGTQFTKRGLVNKAILSRKTGIVGNVVANTQRVTGGAAAGLSGIGEGIGGFFKSGIGMYVVAALVLAAMYSYTRTGGLRGLR